MEANIPTNEQVTRWVRHRLAVAPNEDITLDRLRRRFGLTWREAEDVGHGWDDGCLNVAFGTRGGFADLPRTEWTLDLLVE